MLNSLLGRRMAFPLAVALAVSVAVPGSTIAQAQSMPPEKSMEVFGQRIVYYEAGEGPAVIFLHGLGADASSWMTNLGPFSGKFHVFALDQIGFGKSAKPLVDFKIETFVDFLQAFMQAKKISKASLVGNSLGGWIAAEFAVRHPEMTERLVLVDAAGVNPEGPLAIPPDLNPASLESTRRILESVAYDKSWVTDELVRTVFMNRLQSGDGYTIQRTLAGILAGDQFLSPAELGSIHEPTLAVWGREDRLTPLSSGERLVKMIPGAKLLVFDQCGHIPQMEKAAEFNRAVMEFLSRP